MVAYSFKKMFVPAIRAGLCERVEGWPTPKRQTIRADRRRHARPGEEIQLYTGMRTKQCMLIGRARCVSVEPIGLYFALKKIVIGGAIPQSVRTSATLDEFARDDGFRDFDGMRSFWATTHGSEKFDGVIIRWVPL